jgi:hypothetical protein
VVKQLDYFFNIPLLSKQDLFYNITISITE